MSDIENRYIVPVNSGTKNSSNEFSNTNEFSRYPKIVYRVYERYGDILRLMGDFRYKSYNSRLEALEDVRLLGVGGVIYAVVEEVMLYGN